MIQLKTSSCLLLMSAPASAKDKKFLKFNCSQKNQSKKYVIVAPLSAEDKSMEAIKKNLNADAVIEWKCEQNFKNKTIHNAGVLL